MWCTNGGMPSEVAPFLLTTRFWHFDAVQGARLLCVQHWLGCWHRRTGRASQAEAAHRLDMLMRAMRNSVRPNGALTRRIGWVLSWKLGLPGDLLGDVLQYMHGMLSW